MENPCLTFATPTLLAGDKSLADVIAHEIAHSWTGNLVTNSTWEHFWLNEGWTVWLERKIMSRIKNDQETLKLSAQGGLKHLRDDINRNGADDRFTALVWPLDGDSDPDDAFSGIPYEKGFNLLYYLETIVGKDQFEAFAKAYIQKFKFGTLTSGDFKDFFIEFFNKTTPPVTTEVANTLSNLNWQTLFHAPGMPENITDFSNSLSEASEKLAQEWIQSSKNNSSPSSSSAAAADSVELFATWSTQQKSIFLERLLEYAEDETPLSDSILKDLDKNFNLTACNNSEIKFRWQSLCLLSDADWIVPHVVKFICSQGRMKVRIDDGGMTID